MGRAVSEVLNSTDMDGVYEGATHEKAESRRSRGPAHVGPCLAPLPTQGSTALGFPLLRRHLGHRSMAVVPFPREVRREPRVSHARVAYPEVVA